MRILILDDDADLAHILVLSLRAEGFAVVILTCPHEALKSIHDADVLLTDYHMPKMTGLEVAQRAYTQDWRGVLLIMSGHSSDITGRMEHPLLRSILTKPFSTRELVEKLRSLA